MDRRTTAGVIAALLGPLLALGGYIAYDAHQNSLIREYQEAADLYALQLDVDSSTFRQPPSATEMKQKTDLYFRLKSLSEKTGRPGPEQLKQLWTRGRAIKVIPQQP